MGLSLAIFSFSFLELREINWIPNLTQMVTSSIFIFFFCFLILFSFNLFLSVENIVFTHSALASSLLNCTLHKLLRTHYRFRGCSGVLRCCKNKKFMLLWACGSCNLCLGMLHYSCQAAWCLGGTS